MLKQDLTMFVFAFIEVFAAFVVEVEAAAE